MLNTPFSAFQSLGRIHRKGQTKTLVLSIPIDDYQERVIAASVQSKILSLGPVGVSTGISFHSDTPLEKLLPCQKTALKRMLDRLDKMGKSDTISS